jgi:hypothetical protein
MNVWANLELPAPDDEIAAIDRLERSLGDLPPAVRRVRELITRFEVCHFKVRRHYRHILASIATLQPAVDVERIGRWHPSHGPDACQGDRSGRSRTGQRYINALLTWLGDPPLPASGPPDAEASEIARCVVAWLGERDAETVRMVRRLLARLRWQFGVDGGLGPERHALDRQIDRMDICHYAFPGNLERVLEGIGRDRPVEPFEGCGSFNEEIRAFVAGEYAQLRQWLAANADPEPLELGRRDPVRRWLVTSLAKTLKTHIRLDEPLLPLTA